MDEISGLTPTGRRLRGPASDLVELNGENGLRHTAIVFHEEYLEHRALNESFELVRGFLESPWVTGLVELSDRQGSAFVYPCGECWSVAEVNRILADLGQVGGVRAGLELMYCAGRILIEAGEAGENEGVYSHGGLTPWRIMIRRDGQVLVLGHALPQVEILMFHEDGQRIPREDSFRYCPPERIEQGAEDVSSDLFGLALIGFELMTGRPVYDGLVNDIRQQAARGEGSRRLFRFRDKLPDVVRECLTVALRRDVADRYASGEEFLAAVQEALAAPEVTGSSLMDLMAHVTRQDRRSGNRPDSASTMMASVAEVRSMAGVSVESTNDESARWSSSRSGDKPKARAPIVKSDRLAVHSPLEPVEEYDRDESDGHMAPLPESPVASVPDAPVIPTRSKGKARPSRRSPRRTPSPPGASADITPQVQNSQEMVQSILGEASKSGGGAPRFQKGRASRGKSRSESASANLKQDNVPLGESQKRPSSHTQSTAEAKVDSHTRSKPSQSHRPSKLVGTSTRPSRPAPSVPKPQPKSAPKVKAAPKSAPKVKAAPKSAPKVNAAPKAAPQVKSVPKPVPRVKSAPKAAQSFETSSSVLVTREVSPKARQRSSSAASEPKKFELSPEVSTTKPSSPSSVPKTKAKSYPSSQSKIAKAKPTPSSSKKSTTKAKPEDVDTESMRTAIFSPAELRARLLAEESSDSKVDEGKSAQTKRLDIQFPDSSKPEQMTVSSEWTVGQMVQSWMGDRLRIRTDLTGRVKAWPRLYRDEHRLSGSTSVSELADGQSLKLGWVTNQEVMVDLLVKQAGGDQRVLTPMASAVPMGILLDYLRDWLNLDDGPLKVTAEGRSLGLSEILADLKAEKGRISLTVERAGPQ